MTTAPPSGASIVVCSLEEWGAVRRRMRIMVDELVDMDPSLRVLYVAPAVDIPFELRNGRVAGISRPRFEQVHPRVHVLRPRKWLPRSLGPAADRSLGRQVARAVDDLGLTDPLVWVNDASYARFALSTGWPTVYDVTDDWLLAPLPPRQEARLRTDDDLLLAGSGAVVVCSPDLARTRGARRDVDLIPNGVDVDLFTRPQPRPEVLPTSPVAVYVGTLHEERIDIPLLLALAEARPDVQIALVGPDSLGPAASAQLADVATIHLLGPQPYDQVPGFLQHADLVVIPHLVNPFTESLDPIKAYECIVAGRPTVATPVAGFRDLGDPVVVCDRTEFVAVASGLLDSAADPATTPAPTPGAATRVAVASWRDRAESMDAVMRRVRNESGAA
ncbi:MAG: glycosyltransferase [Acidimicrobiales bacterium]